MYIYVYTNIFCAFVGLENKLYKMQSTYIKIRFVLILGNCPT